MQTCIYNHNNSTVLKASQSASQCTHTKLKERVGALREARSPVVAVRRRGAGTHARRSLQRPEPGQALRPGLPAAEVWESGTCLASS